MIQEIFALVVVRRGIKLDKSKSVKYDAFKIIIAYGFLLLEIHVNFYAKMLMCLVLFLCISNEI